MKKSKNNSGFKVGAELKAAEKSLAKNARHFSGLSSACHPKVFIKTFGWQMGAVLYDYSVVFEQVW